MLAEHGAQGCNSTRSTHIEASTKLSLCPTTGWGPTGYHQLWGTWLTAKRIGSANYGTREASLAT
ncbi:hypothetical protein CFIMG_007458RA00001 [Ceratocystis fimbriata CBS 114723]|uniref:Uncharacterized protein n=1 Tax=Ceratocystis fimbriata CBS 114723 TaxID=1035309 RepID=A0A2C5XDC8_9PEZI|nr:hypothetical protein CFIMG_007458RA00001 [Ceratocystis fimbriata CBS 114723]